MSMLRRHLGNSIDVPATEQEATKAVERTGILGGPADIGCRQLANQSDFVCVLNFTAGFLWPAVSCGENMSKDYTQVPYSEPAESSQPFDFAREFIENPSRAVRVSCCWTRPAL
jgi:hypothetical protein